MDVVVCAVGYRKGWCEFNKTVEAENSDSEAVTAAVTRGDTIAALNPVLRGWTSYFRLTEVKGVLQDLDGWLRRKLRCLQWKRPATPKQEATGSQAGPAAGVEIGQQWPRSLVERQREPHERGQ